jgi:transcriptional regulator with XRE-family HTH domain
MLGALILAERRQRGWTQAELGRRAGLSHTRVWEIEGGRALRVSRHTLAGLAVALEIPVERLEAAAGPQLPRAPRPRQGAPG